MTEDLQNEIQAINSIYGPDTLVPELTTTTDHTARARAPSYILNIQHQSVSVRLGFPDDYPLSPPRVLGTQHVGGDSGKGTGTWIVEVVREVLTTVFREGDVCLFDVLEEVRSLLKAETDTPNVDGGGGGRSRSPVSSNANGEKDAVRFACHEGDFEGNSSSFNHIVAAPGPLQATPPWTVSTVITENKSVFVARAALVSSPAQAKQYIHHLLRTDKKVAKATHNITAWRIRGEGNATFQDCDDDGETAAGGRLLHLIQVMDLWDVVVVVTRWYGGVQLGPDRFRIINTVARDALVEGGFVKGKADKAGTVKKKGKK
ncbi:eIF2 kinase Gcn2p negative regulator [Acarospora aff. strigata]|nr:eIF2 kinase Gcn2p negative regulator [Acarospora aff. strigata]